MPILMDQIANMPAFSPYYPYFGFRSLLFFRTLW